ncbi:hypothetical protein IMY05_C3108000100 [Salix suchowensis]|nr:hypothetical protein IMY05_C3108000100 [Salix suchowensis]
MIVSMFGLSVYSNNQWLIGTQSFWIALAAMPTGPRLPRHGLRTREEPPTHVGDPALNLTETDFFLTDRPHRFIKTTPNGDYGWYSCIRQMTKILKSSPDKLALCSTNALSTAAHWQYLWEASEAILSPSTPAANITLRSRTPVIRQNIYNTRLHDSFNSTLGLRQLNPQSPYTVHVYDGPTNSHSINGSARPLQDFRETNTPLHSLNVLILMGSSAVHHRILERAGKYQGPPSVTGTRGRTSKRSRGPSLPDCDDVCTAWTLEPRLKSNYRYWGYPGQNTALITMLVADEAINAITRSARVVCFSIERQRVGADELGGTVHIRGSATATHPGGGCGSIPACDVGEERRTTSSLKKRGRRATVFRARGET